MMKGTIKNYKPLNQVIAKQLKWYTEHPSSINCEKLGFVDAVISNQNKR